MAKTFELKLLSPDTQIFVGLVEAVSLPGEQGDLGVLPRHTKLVTALKPGALRMVVDGKTERFAVSGGFAEVHARGITVLADSAERPGDIDVPRAERARDRALEAIAETDPTDRAKIEFLQAHLARAQNRISIARAED